MREFKTIFQVYQKTDGATIALHDATLEKYEVANWSVSDISYYTETDSGKVTRMVVLTREMQVNKRVIDDITGGRVNTENLTLAEREFMNSAYGRDWFLPNDSEWLLLRNLLALFDIRRGYSVEWESDEFGEYPYLQAGTAQVRLNPVGRRALDMYRETGEYLKIGSPTTFADIEPYLTPGEIKLFKG